MLPSAGKGSLANMALVAHLKDALALELKKVKTEVQQSLRAKQNEALALKKEAARKSTTISGLEEVNEKRKDQIVQMKALIQPLRDALVDQGVELAHLNTEAEELRRKVSVLEEKVRAGDERTKHLDRKLQVRSKDALRLSATGGSVTEAMGLDYDNVNKRKVQVDQENKRVERITLGAQIDENIEASTTSADGFRDGPKRKRELVDYVKSKKVKLVEHLVTAQEGQADVKSGKVSRVKTNPPSVDNTYEKLRFNSGTEDMQDVEAHQEEEKGSRTLVSVNGLWLLKDGRGGDVSSSVRQESDFGATWKNSQPWVAEIQSCIAASNIKGVGMMGDQTLGQRAKELEQATNSFDILSSWP